ncbi:hypothetical protein BGZ81_011514 [Podila clonocystis]|nr:hypothetical protein BGZ81_011514 [Podila clonocystis]
MVRLPQKDRITTGRRTFQTDKEASDRLSHLSVSARATSSATETRSCARDRKHNGTTVPTAIYPTIGSFIRICETIQKTQEYPGCPSRDLLIISRTPAFTSGRESALKDHCAWVESIIRSRATGWQSCVKLKLQFYAVFEESDICKDARAPLFGSWDLWQLNVEGLLTSTLNQMVASDNSSSVPPQTVDALIKISLIAPYHVVSKIVHSATVNKGQGPLFLQLLLDLGQLVWLKPSAEDPTLFLLVISDIINNREHNWTFSDEGAPRTAAQLENFAKMVEGAMSTRSRSGVLLLDPSEFLRYCAIPMLKVMERVTGDKGGGPCFDVVTKIILAIYLTDSTVMTGYSDWFSLDAHSELLAILLHLQTLKSPWSMDRLHRDEHSTTWIPRRGGQHLDSIMIMCEAVVSRLASAVEESDKKMDSGQRTRLSKFLELVQRDGAIDVESKLSVAPLMLACRRNLAMELDIPLLPVEISGLFNRPLWQFRCKESEPSNRSEVPVVLSLVAAFDIGRLCEELMQDIGQSHRLFAKGVTAVMDMLGGIGLDDIAIFDQADKEESTVARLGSYWKEYIEGVKELSEKTTLAMLLVSQPLLQLALNPFPHQHRHELIQVYRYGLGFDALVDQVASLIQSSIKNAIVDWPSMPLDLVLFSFMAVCRMGHTLAIWQPDRETVLRVDPDSAANWDDIKEHARHSPQQYATTSTVADHGLDLVNCQEQESIALSKARDELVLMAMNFSEEVVRRQDEYYQPEILWEKEQKKKQTRPAAGHGRGKRQARNFGRNIRQPPKGGDVLHAMNPAFKKDMDKDSSAESSSSQSSSSQGGSALSTLSSTPNPDATAQETSNAPASEEENRVELLPMLSSDQQTCLMLALNFLPPQEQHAIGARLSRLLKHCT